MRRAERPGQTVNIDIALVPVNHEAEDKLPAVSCSSGKLVVEKPREEESERQYPGRVFEKDWLSYEDAMKEFISSSEAQSGSSSDMSRSPEKLEHEAIKAQKKAFNLEEVHLRNARRDVRSNEKKKIAYGEISKSSGKMKKNTKKEYLLPRKRLRMSIGNRSRNNVRNRTNAVKKRIKPGVENDVISKNERVACLVLLPG